MRSRFFLPTLAVSLLLAPSLASAIEVTHSQLQSLYYYTSTTTGGTTTTGYKSKWSVNNGNTPLQLVGVVINNPVDMLDYSLSSTSPNGPQWQTYIQALPGGTYGGQAVSDGDFGGAALYMMKNGYNSAYDEAGWESEMTRINNPYMSDGVTQVSLTTGDVISVQANAPGMYYKGKFNINEKHWAESAYDFTITVLQRGYTPTASEISLANLKDTSDKFIFDNEKTYDQTISGTDYYTVDRSYGCEHYQGSLVSLHNLQLANPAATWADNTTVAVQQQCDDGITRTFNLYLGMGKGLSDSSPGSSLFDVTAILDQEGSTSGTDGYRLWLTSTDNISVVPEPGAFTLLVIGLVSLAAYAWRKRR